MGNDWCARLSRLDWRKTYQEEPMADPLFSFEGKVVLVTGGSRGLGYQMVKAFAERGADVIIASRKIEACEEVA